MTSTNHDEKLSQPKWGDDYCLGNVCRCDRDLVMDTYQIHLEEILLAAKLPLKYCMWGKGYLSSTIALLRHQKSPHGLQPQPCFGAM